MASLPVDLPVFPHEALGEGTTWSSKEGGGRWTSASLVKSVESVLMSKGVMDVSARLRSHLDQELMISKAWDQNNA
jgi:hypothetical protein